MTETTSVRRVQRVRHELRRRELSVLRSERISPHFVAVTLGGEALSDFRSDGFDDHVKLLFDGGAEGVEPVRRDYTPRRFDRAAGELTIEFVLHGHGAAATWARDAKPGDLLAVGGPRGSMIVPMDYEWHLLAGDATALPAIHRRLEELPAGSRALVLADVEEADRRAFDSKAEVSLQWVDGDEAWLAALAALKLPPGEGYAWCAGEASVMARAREVLLQQHGHPREAMRVAAYWKRGATAFHENLEG